MQRKKKKEKEITTQYFNGQGFNIKSTTKAQLRKSKG
jgi:hypothetical protein